jgi:adenylate kinase
VFPHGLVEQWLQLDEMLARQGAKVDKVLNFAIDDAILEERITGRWIHPSSGRSYHTKFAPPKIPGIDDVSQIQSTCSCMHMSYLHDSV